MKKLYELPEFKGDGTADNPRRPDHLDGILGWSVYEDRGDSFLVIVNVSDEIHAAITEKIGSPGIILLD